MGKSIVEYYPEREKHKCGYCKQRDTSVVKGMWAYTLTINDYQELIDRGWRRSGQYCYKPTMDQTCCPCYTIKCDVVNFKLNKSHKKLLKRISKFVSSIGVEDLKSNKSGDKSLDKSEECSTSSQECAETNTDFLMEMSGKKHKTIDINFIQSSSPPQHVSLSRNRNERKVEGNVSNDSQSKIPCKKAKQLRIERKKDKMLKKGIEWNPQDEKRMPKNPEKTLEDFLDSINTSTTNFKIKLVRTSPISPEWLSTSTKTHELYTKYQTTIHNEPVHKCTENQYKRFLVNSPLLAYCPPEDIPMGYGSFHQQYWLGEELIAVGVIDILPHCVSSVYFYYDPKYAHLSLGTFGTLQEIALTRKLQKINNNIKSYYLGFYIHSCPKMKYKGNYSPSFLLCPETYKWFPIQDCFPKIDSSPYSRLNPNLDDIDEDNCEEKDLGEVGIFLENMDLKFMQCKALLTQNTSSNLSEIMKELLEYGSLVGKNCSQRMLYVLQ